LHFLPGMLAENAQNPTHFRPTLTPFSQAFAQSTPRQNANSCPSPWRVASEQKSQVDAKQPLARYE
jgi:hypothetical protein